MLTPGLDDTFPSSLPPPPWSLYSSSCGQAATGTDGQGDVPPLLIPSPLCWGYWELLWLSQYREMLDLFESIHLRCK